MTAMVAPRQTRVSRPRLGLRGILDILSGLDARYRMQRTLLELDDRMLRDMGLSRADVAQELRRPRIG